MSSSNPIPIWRIVLIWDAGDHNEAMSYKLRTDMWAVALSTAVKQLRKDKGASAVGNIVSVQVLCTEDTNANDEV